MGNEVEIVTTPWYDAELRELPEHDQRRVGDRLRAFGDKGWRQAIADQTVKHLRDGIHELRVLGRGAAFRVLFFVVPGRSPRVVVLTTCAAKALLTKRQRLNAEIERACVRRVWWLEQQKKEEDDARV
jgi:phage-related protein